LGELSPSEVYETLTSGGVPATEAGLLVANWLLENYGDLLRHFKPQTPFPAEDPACVSQFQRTFAHQDWVDGESVVQAETTPGEEGFNARFHKIETDLEALGQDTARAFACIAEMRKSLHAIVEEIRTEINRINQDVYACCHKTPTTPVVAAPIGAADATIRQPGFLGKTRFFGRPVTVWRTSTGLITLPLVSEAAAELGASERVKRGTLLARFMTDNQQVSALFAQGPVKRDALVKAFGMQEESGVLVRDLVAILPPEPTFTAPDALLGAVIDREASALRTEPNVDQILAIELGLDEVPLVIGVASVEHMLAVPAEVRNELLELSIRTVGELAQQSAADLAKNLTTRGIESQRRDAAAWITAARLLRAVR
jgi:hypothetical protein